MRVGKEAQQGLLKVTQLARTLDANPMVPDLNAEMLSIKRFPVPPQNPAFQTTRPSRAMQAPVGPRALQS